VGLVRGHLETDNQICPLTPSPPSPVDTTSRAMDSTGIPSIKRLHSETTDFGDGIAPPKRQRPDSTSGNPSENSNTPNVRQALLDALGDISDEIRFAVKCIDRHAGDEASMSHLVTS
jgi:hypothetical protein